MHRRQRQWQSVKAFLIVFLLIIIVLTINLVVSISKNSPENTVEEFYKLEQQKDYGRSWELLHPLMQERFERSNYFLDRAHVFNGHFGAETFSYKISDAKKHKQWKMEKGGKTFEVAYGFEVHKPTGANTGTSNFSNTCTWWKRRGNGGLCGITSSDGALPLTFKTKGTA